MRADIYYWGRRSNYDPWRALAVAVLKQAKIDAMCTRKYQRRRVGAYLQHEARRFIEEWIREDENNRG